MQSIALLRLSIRIYASGDSYSSYSSAAAAATVEAASSILAESPQIASSRALALMLNGAALEEASVSQAFVSESPVSRCGKMQSEDRGHTGTLEHAQQATGLLEMGAMVRMHSLQSATEHNGLMGEIVERDATKDRWGIRTVTGRVLSLKPSNLTRVGRAATAEYLKAPKSAAGGAGEKVPQDDENLKLRLGDTVKICKVQRLPEHNGVLGKIIQDDFAGGLPKGSFSVKTVDGRVLLLKPTNLIRVEPIKLTSCQKKAQAESRYLSYLTKDI